MLAARAELSETKALEKKLSSDVKKSEQKYSMSRLGSNQMLQDSKVNLPSTEVSFFSEKSVALTILNISKLISCEIK